MYVIMFKHVYLPVGPFESFEAATQYGLREIESTLCNDCNDWKVRQLDAPRQRVHEDA